MAVVYLPGRALLGATGGGALEEILFSLGLGTVAATAAFRLAAAAGRPALALLIAPAAALAFAVRRQRPWPSLHARPWHAGLAAVLVLACLPFALVPMCYRNLDRLPGGRLTYVPMPDAVLHLSIARGLTTSFPPEVPFLPGTPLHYHYGMDALPALFAGGLGLDVGDLTLRFVPTFFMGLLVLGLVALGRAWVGTAAAGLAAALLTVLGEDLAWIPGALRGSRELWAVYFLGAPTTSSLYALNPMLPGITFVVLALLALQRQGERGGWAWAARAAVLMAAAADYKVFAAAQLLAAAAAAAAVYALRRRDWRPAAALAVAIAFTLALAPPGAAAASALVRLDPWPYVPAALVRSGLGGSWLGRETDALLLHGQRTATSLAAFFGLAVPLYLVAVFGARLMGLPALLRALRPRPAQAARLTAALFVLVGPALSLLFAVTPATYEPRTQYNNAIWFLVQSKLVAWVFVAEQLWRWAAFNTRRALPLCAGVLAVSLPSTVQYFQQQLATRQVQVLGPDEVGLLEEVDRALPPGTVALARPDVAAALLAVTRARAPVFTVYPIYFVSSDDLQAHGRRLAEFWAEWRRGRFRPDIAQAYRASVVVADLRREGPAAPAWGLTALYQNGGYALYALPAADLSRKMAP